MYVNRDGTVRLISSSLSQGISSKPPFCAIEGNNVIFDWTLPFEMSGVKWFKGGIRGDMIMSYTAINNQTTIEDDGYNVEFLNVFNSVGMVLRDATVDASDEYTVLVNMTDHRQDYSTTSLTVIRST